MTARLVLLLMLLALAATGCGRSGMHSQESYVFGTRIEVLVWGKPEAEARPAVAEVLREFDRLHRTYHAWQPSEMTALNQAIAAGRPHSVSAEFADFIRQAQALSARGDHLFDPGIGQLVALWGFHDDTFKPQLPEPASLAALIRARPSIADLSVAPGPCPALPGDATAAEEAVPAGGCVTSRNRAVALDFGGYLKGVALDRAAAMLRARGMNDALVNIGGNVMALGSKGGTPWRVGIQHPRQPVPLATLELKDGEAIGTSGDYQRYFELDGRRYCHLIDPRSGRPATATEAVTVLIPPGGDAGMLSDVASKPLFIAGEAWPAMAGRLGVDRVLRIGADGRLQVTPELRPRLHFEDSATAVQAVPVPAASTP